MLPLIIAHRGNSSERPENTRAAFESALELGVPLIELDVHLTRDGQVVVLHDDTLERTTNGAGAVASRSLLEIRSLSAGYARRFGDAYPALRVPTLDEALALMAGRARVLIEIKRAARETEPERLALATVAAVRRARLEDECALISFDRATLEACRAHAPEVARGLLARRGEAQGLVDAARALGCAELLPEKRLLSDRLCRLARSAGLGVSTWVVDEPEELAELLRFDLVGVASNRPGALLAYSASGPVLRS